MVRIPKALATLLALTALACTANTGGGAPTGGGQAEVPSPGSGQQSAGGWRGLIHDAHLGSILEAEKRADALNESLPPDAYGLSDLPQARELLAAPALPLRRDGLAGEWRCRSLQVNRSGVFVYPFFRCRIWEEGGRLLFDKLTGSQRRSGEISDAGPHRFVFLGGATVNDDPRRPYSATQAGWDDESTAGDTVGVLTRKGDGRLLMILDATADSYELYELRREGAAR